MAERRASKLDGLAKEQRQELVDRLRKTQNSLCYVCQEVINAQVHKIDIDHIRRPDAGARGAAGPS